MYDRGSDSTRLLGKKQRFAVTCRHKIEAGIGPRYLVEVQGDAASCMLCRDVGALFGSCYLRRFMLLL
jgi:hypothetical protein